MTGRVADVVGGIGDLRRKLIRAVGKPEDRFREDPLRLLRAIRQKNERKGYAIEKSTWLAILRCAPEILRTIPAERTMGELLRSLLANPEGTVLDLHRSGILKILLPETYDEGNGPARIRMRYAALGNSLGRPLPEIPLLANLLVDVAARECDARIRSGLPESRRGRTATLAKEDEKRSRRFARSCACWRTGTGSPVSAC
jgi:tRNA nucleotidyltransferase/poly(A) polymerase